MFSLKDTQEAMGEAMDPLMEVTALRILRI